MMSDPYTLQPYEPGNAYIFDGQTITSQQTLPPATAPHLAFRPSCDQLQPIEQANGLTAWTVPNPLGQGVVVISEQPSGLETSQAWLYADADGACKLNGVPVPIVLAEGLPKALIPETQASLGVADGVHTTDTFIVGTQAYVGAGFILVGLILAVVAIAAKPRQVAPGSREDAFTTLLNIAKGENQ